MAKSLLYRATLLSIIKIFSYRALWADTLRCFNSILKNFFVLQYKAALFPKKFKVTQVDHPLDNEILFNPNWVDIYMDFSPFWIRTQGFLLEEYGSGALEQVKDFLVTMAELYEAAASVYRQNFSTTNRPHYYGKLKFVTIHIFDPHLMCIPSLHVMAVVCTFVKFHESIKHLGGEAQYAKEMQWARNHAIAITESILYVKQHSVNCISAALYAMTCYDIVLFNAADMMRFITGLFQTPGGITVESAEKIKQHIGSLYAVFLAESKTAQNWQEPLLRFLKKEIADA